MTLKKTIVGAATALALGGGVVLTDQQINPYIPEGTLLKIYAVSSLEAAGVIQNILDTDMPKVTMKKWGGEATLGVQYKGISATTKGSRAFMTNRVEWKDNKAKQEMHAYPLSATTTMEDGGMEIEVILNEKPATNVFEFQIDGAENLDFFYQPALTAEDIADDASRPENVIGSYAVYHKTKANHRVGDTNYASGKAYHIFRPKVIDANGAGTWAVLSYENGVLSVTVPQSFLDIAMYPVKVDPTFGYTTQGATSVQLNPEDISATKGTISYPSTATTTSRYEPILSSSNAKGIIFRDSDKVIVTNGVSRGENINGWGTVNFPTRPLLDAETYWIGWIHDGAGTAYYAYDTGVAGDSWTDTSNNYTTPTDPTDGSAGDRLYSMYVTYLYQDVLVLNSTAADIGMCYQSGTAACFYGFTSLNARLGFRTGVNFGHITGGFRFNNITIPQGSTIEAATFGYTAFDSDSSDIPTIFIFAEDSDDSAALTTSGAGAVDTLSFGGSRPTTTAVVSWTLVAQTIGNGYYSPDIKTIIQEVIDRPGWVSGNDLMIITSPSSVVDNFNALAATSSALLSISYSPGGTAATYPANVSGIINVNGLLNIIGQ